ncbi:MAG: prepilin-type N-terminal cleavage/methylation domain-containing protein [Candidatus Omnitrophota bacterium]|nr:prepilin-type N-terminal cleavage/methylation domain-containing protein [Candidatus Omnitrophota bacterium]
MAKQSPVTAKNILRRNKEPGIENSRQKTIEGFTMIETIMVIVILGILAALTIPRFNSFYGIKLAGAMKSVVSDIRYVQQFAVSHHADSRIEFNTAANSYQACYCNEADGACASGSCTIGANWSAIPDPFTRGGLGINFTSDLQYRGIVISSPNFNGSTLRFNWQGIPQDAGGTNLTGEGSVNFSYQGNSEIIYVTPATGRIGIQ